MQPPEPGTWRVNASLVGTRIHIEHLSEDPGVPVYQDVEDLTMAELRITLARAVRPGLGVELGGGLRSVTTRIEYEDLAGAPFVPPDPDLHHRDETLGGISDLALTAHGARAAGPWTLAGRLGVSIPTGRTEENPFELGRLGVRHQHIQFGTGTWDPLVGLAASRRFGATGVAVQGIARLVVAENAHGYRAGHRFSAGIVAGHDLGAGWRGHAGLELAREEAEEWDGRREEEGNLGRTDLWLVLGLGHAGGPAGSLGLTARLPAHTRSSGEQVDQPLVLALEWGP